ncbi:MAG: hypothetical protein Q9217_006819 [Psora testacea]
MTLTSLVTEASPLPNSIPGTKSVLNARGWRRKTKPDEKILEAGDYPKYFHEPEGNDLAHHYDTRYSHGILSYDEKHDTQIHLIHSYLEFFQNNGMETWLAHGTLLGWWWNARMLPWDWDVDTQVSIATLVYLAENHNSTVYTYTSATDTVVNSVTKKEEAITRQYHLDINPAHPIRERGDGDNVIDARWIDVRNGLYIDITGVAETHPQVAPGIWSCKNYHRYRTRDLWPMRETVYESVTVKVPYAYERILEEEYGEKALVVGEYQGHKWSGVDHLWVKKTPAEMKQGRLGRQAAGKTKHKQKTEAKRLQKAEEREKQMAKLKEQKEAKGKEGKESAKAGELEKGVDESERGSIKDQAKRRREDGWRRIWKWDN